jgi:benzodiazapine receptor
MKSKKNIFSVLAGMIFLCLIVELLGGWLTSQSVHDWYPLLKKPFWTPPPFVFGPVWTILYLLMAIALWLVWKEPVAKSKKTAYTFFSLQLFFNLIWSGLFFALRSPLMGLIDILILYGFIIATMVSFYRIKPLAAYLLIPYLCWVSYAITLNAAIWYLN